MAEAGGNKGGLEGHPPSSTPALWPAAVGIAFLLFAVRLAGQFASVRAPLLERTEKGFDAAVPLLVGLVMLWSSTRVRSFGQRPVLAWRLLALAYLSYGSGEVAFAWLGVGLSQGLESYVNSIVYIAFYVLFLVGVLQLPATPLAAQERVKLLVDTAIVLLAVGLVAWTLFLQPMVGLSDAAPFKLFVAVAFLVGDLMVLWALIELLLRPRDPSVATVYGLLAAAATFLIVTDVLWGRQVISLRRNFDWALGPGWTASHLLAGLAAVWWLVHVPSRAAKSEAPRRTPGARTSLLLAYGCGSVAFAVFVFRHLNGVTALSSLFLVGMVLLVAGRHVLGLRENTRLWSQLQTAHDDLEAKVSERTAELNEANVVLQAEIDRRRRAQEETQRRLKELILLSAVTEIAVEARDENELFTKVTLAIRGTLYPDNCGFLLVNEAEGTVEHTPSFHSVIPAEAALEIALGEGITGRVAASGVARRVADTAREPDYLACDPDMRSEVCVPLRMGDAVVGVLDAESASPDAFTEDDERILGTVANQVAASMERLHASEALRQSEENYREVFNATSEAIFVHDASTGAILDVNQTMLDLYGYTRAEAFDLGVADLSIQRAPFTEEEARARIRRAIEEGPQVFEWMARRRDGTEFWAEVALRSSLIGGKGRVLAVVRDISARRRAEEALRLSEERFRSMVQQAYDFITVLDATGTVIYESPSTSRVLGYGPDDMVGRSGFELIHPDDLPLVQKALARVAAEGSSSRATQYRVRHAGGRWVDVESLGNNLLDNPAVRGIVLTSRDVSERVRAEEALRLSEDRFRTMVQQSYDFLVVVDASGKITYATPRAGRTLGHGEDGLIGRNAFGLAHPEDLQALREAFERTAQGRGTGRPIEFRVRRADGSWLHLEGIGSNQLEHPSIRGIVLNAREIGERKKAEEEIRRKLKELTVLNAVAGLAVQAEDEDLLIARATEIVRDALYPDDCGVLLADEEAGVLRYTASYRQGVSGVNREPIPLGCGITGNVASTGAPRRVGDVTRDRDYISRLPGMRSELCVPMKVGQHRIGVLNAESAHADAFTEHDEAVLGTIASQLATAIGRLRAGAAQRESEERFRRLADAAFEGIGITDQGRIVDANPRLAEMLGYEPGELLGRSVMDFVAPEAAEQVESFMRQGKDELYEHLAIRKDGSVFPVETQGRPLAGGGTIRVAAVRDITERKRAEQRIQRQLDRLAALRAIDAAITGGLDLPVTLDLFLSQVLAQLHVDAADILAFEPTANVLSFAAGKGFRSDAVRDSRLGLGECYAGKAALERRTIAVPDLAERPNGFTRASLLSREGFEIYFAAPLVAKGHVHGVLEVFSRTKFEPDGEWLDYLDTLAGQLAIAIDNRTLFEDLQRSNAELEQAYDTTLEGWSKALELRDRETHGHTARVVELTVRLASVMGMRAKDLVHVRRGALLHDIGKMAIPDSILLKPGPLDAGEWEVMRRHPSFAFELLSPISFLGSAIDVPYCHHERWDGTGYPRGLSGEEIPLAARIFAVIDAWDALSFARPYREAWTEERVRAHLREEAGRRFDPAVVEVFLGMSGRR